MKADRKAEALSERGGELDDTHPTDPYPLGYLDVFEPSRGAERSDSPGPLGQHLDACAHCRGRRSFRNPRCR